jgi:hypothetical protein
MQRTIIVRTSLGRASRTRDIDIIGRGYSKVRKQQSSKKEKLV